jgi:hypothetical protein
MAKADGQKMSLAENIGEAGVDCIFVPDVGNLDKKLIESCA